MRDIEINAVAGGIFDPGEYGSVEVNGIANCAGSFTAQELEVNGVLKAQGAVRCDEGEINGCLECGRLDAGEMEINGAVQAAGGAGIETVDVSGALTVTGKLECSSVTCDGAIKVSEDMTAATIGVDGALNVKGGVFADTIEVDGCLNAGGQVSADKVHVEGAISAAEVVGDEVVICRQGRVFTGLGITVTVGGRKISVGDDSGRREQKTSTIGLIEATTIVLEGVSAQTVNGTDITIGEGCDIENLDCNGTLRIGPTSHVVNITGDCTVEITE